MLLPLPNNSCNLCGRDRSRRDAAPCPGPCVRGGLGPRDYALESAILLELSRHPTGTCLSLDQALAGVVADEDEVGWRRARLAARRLQARRQLELTCGGEARGGDAEFDERWELRLPHG